MTATASRAAAVLALMDAAADAPRGAWDPHADIGVFVDGSGWYWTLSYRTGAGNTRAHTSAVQRWDRQAFLLKILEQTEAAPTVEGP